MQHKHPLAGSPAPSLDANPAPTARGLSRRARIRSSHAAKPPTMQIRRILVLAHRFHALCALKSEPERLIDLLRTLIACARVTFDPGSGPRSKARASGPATAEQAGCLNDLELLMQNMVVGSPDASLGLAHALDGLLVQCVVFDAAETTDHPECVATTD